MERKISGFLNTIILKEWRVTLKFNFLKKRTTFVWYVSKIHKWTGLLVGNNNLYVFCLLVFISSWYVCVFNLLTIIKRGKETNWEEKGNQKVESPGNSNGEKTFSNRTREWWTQHCHCLLDLFLLCHVPVLRLSGKIQNPPWNLISDKHMIRTMPLSHALFMGQSHTKTYYLFICNSTFTRCLLWLLVLLSSCKACHPKSEASCCPTVLDIGKPSGQRRGLLGTFLEGNLGSDENEIKQNQISLSN